MNSLQVTAESSLPVAVAEMFEVPGRSYEVMAQSIAIAQNSAEKSVAPISVVTEAPKQEVNWLFWFAVVWLSGCTFLVTRLTIGWLKLRRILSLSEKASLVAPWLEKICCELSVESRIRSKVQVLITDQISTPATTGFFRSVILVPKRCVTELSTDQQRLVLAHELVHVRRCDGFFQLVAWAIQTIHWFNPLVHFAVRKMADHRELSCDQAVLSTLNGRNKTLYGQTILKLAELESANNQIPTILARGFIGSKRKLITQRIDMITNPKSTRWPGTFLGAMVVLTMLTVGYTAAQTQEESPESDIPTVEQAQPKTAGSRDQDSNSSADRVASRNAAWPKPFARNRMHTLRIYSEPVTGDWPEEFPPHLVFARNAAWPKPFPSRTRIEYWAPIRKKAVAKKTTYSHPGAEASQGSEASNPSRVPINLVAGTERMIRFDKRIPQMVSFQPEVLELTPLAPRELLFCGEKPGVCNVDLTYEDGTTESIVVNVVYETEELEKVLKQRFPNSKVKIISTPNGINLLCDVTGSRSAKGMIKIAEALTGAKVHAAYARDAQVSFAIQVYEISIDKFKEAITTQDGEDLKILSQFLVKKDQNSSEQKSPQLIHQIDDQSRAAIQKLVQRKSARLVNEPKIISAFGQEGEFFAGSEIVHRLPNGKFETRRIGNMLNVTAVQGVGDKVTLELIAEFSDVDPSLSSGEGKPGSSVRRISTGVQTRFGATVMLIHQPTKAATEAKATVMLITTNRLPKK